MAKQTPLLLECFEFLKMGSVVDFGSGDGSNIAFLRDKGFSVYGVEKNYGETIEDFIAKNTALQDNFISFYTLHFLHKEDMYAVYRYMKDHTQKNGVNMVTHWIKDGDWQDPSLLNPNELKEIYKDWRILHYEEKLVTTYTGSQQMAAFIVAKKP